MDGLTKDILAALKRRTGIDFERYQRATVEHGIALRMAALQCTSRVAYLTQLGYAPDECDELVRALSINVTSFFRNPIVFEILGEKILPGILERKRQRGHQEFRAWCAGCATGEEPYSLAMVLREVIERCGADFTTHIFATDINQDSLLRAEAGVYAEEQLDAVRFGLLKRFLPRKGRRHLIGPEIRGMVSFSQDDLTSSLLTAPPESVFGDFDVVLCRNVLIYLQRSLQVEVCERITRSLRIGGYLVLGEAEKLPSEFRGGFRSVDHWSPVYQKKA